MLFNQGCWSEISSWSNNENNPGKNNLFFQLLIGTSFLNESIESENFLKTSSRLRPTDGTASVALMGTRGSLSSPNTNQSLLMSRLLSFLKFKCPAVSENKTAMNFKNLRKLGRHCKNIHQGDRALRHLR